MRMKRRDWLRGVERRIAEPAADNRDWLIELEVQMSVQDMASSAARIADIERLASGR